MNSRTKILDKVFREIKTANEETARKREKKKRKVEQRREEHRAKKKLKTDQEDKFKEFTPVLQAAGYCKRSIPSLKQIKCYLKKEKKLTSAQLNEIQEEHVVTQWVKYI